MKYDCFLMKNRNELNSKEFQASVGHNSQATAAVRQDGGNQNAAQQHPYQQSRPQQIATNADLDNR